MKILLNLIKIKILKTFNSKNNILLYSLFNIFFIIFTVLIFILYKPSNWKMVIKVILKLSIILISILILFTDINIVKNYKFINLYYKEVFESIDISKLNNTIYIPDIKFINFITDRYNLNLGYRMKHNNFMEIILSLERYKNEYQYTYIKERKIYENIIIFISKINKNYISIENKHQAILDYIFMLKLLERPEYSEEFKKFIDIALNNSFKLLYDGNNIREIIVRSTHLRNENNIDGLLFIYYNYIINNEKTYIDIDELKEIFKPYLKKYKTIDKLIFKMFKLDEETTNIKLKQAYFLNIL